MRAALCLGLCASLLLAASPALAADEVTHYPVYISGKKAGEQVVTRHDDGLVEVAYSYRNNGRGPTYAESFRLAPDGTFTEFHIKGNSTFGAAVDEHFTLKDGTASWTTLSDKHSGPVPPGAMYVPLNNTFEAAGAIIAAVAARKDGRLPLLPGGTLTHKTLGTLEATRGSERRPVQLLAQTGLGLQPSFVWATVEPRPRFFAAVYPGFFLAIEAGFEDNKAAMEAMQIAAQADLLKSVAARLQPALPGLTVVRNTRVFDSNTATLGAPSDVYVLRGRVTAVLPTGTPVQGVSQQIDAQGRVMLPGLFDMHGHVQPWDGGLNLAAGVTTVRDMGNSNPRLGELMDDLAAGQWLGPQIVGAGMLEGESEQANRGDFVVSTLPQAKEAIDWYAGHGYVQLKIYNSYPKAILADTVAYAHSRGLRVSGHVPAFLRAQDVVDAGFDEIQHINQVMLNFLVTPTTDTRSLDRFILPAEKVAGLDFDSRPVQDFIALLAKKQVVVDPTLTTFDFIRHREGEMSQAFGRIVEHLPPDLQRYYLTAEMKIPDDAAAKRYDQSFRKMVEFVGRLYRAGVPIVAGTDEMAGFTLHRELEFYVEAGLTPSQVLQIATRNGARYSRTEHDRGSIEVGKLADLVLVDGDPTQDISAVRKVALVITRGRVISPGAVYTELGIKPFVADEPVVQKVEPVEAAGPDEVAAH